MQPSNGDEVPGASVAGHTGSRCVNCLRATDALDNSPAIAHFSLGTGVLKRANAAFMSGFVAAVQPHARRLQQLLRHAPADNQRSAALVLKGLENRCVVTLGRSDAAGEPGLRMHLSRAGEGKEARIVCVIEPPAGATRISRAHSLLTARGHTGVWTWLPQRDQLRGCSGSRRIVGAALHSLSAFLTRVDERDRDRIGGVLTTAVAEWSSFEAEVRLSVGSDTRTVVISGAPDTSGRSRLAPRFFGTIEDVSAQRAATDALMTLSTAVEQTANHVCITDEDGVIQYANPAWRIDRGVPPSALIGQPLSSLFGDAAALRDGMGVAGATGSFRAVFERVEDGGQVRYEETTILPVRDMSGQATSFVVLGSDITEKRRAEAASAVLKHALLTAASEWRHTVDAIEWPIVLFDRASRIGRMNRAARDLLGHSSYERVGTDLADLDVREPWHTVRAVVERLGPALPSGRERAVDVDGGRTWDIVAAFSPEDEETAEGVIVVLREVTTTLMMEASLRRSAVMSAMGSLAAGFAHEVKNPLFGLTATLDAMENRFADADHRRYTSMLRMEIDRLSNLTRGLLDYGKAAQLDLQPSRIGSVIGVAADLCSLAAAARNVTIDNSVPPAFGRCRVDALKLHQAFRNVLENAVQFSPPNGRVFVSAEEIDRAGARWIVISIRDQGAGLAASESSRAFEPFFTRRPGGTGLGLSIVQRIVEEHCGSVSATNAPGGGALFTFELPALPAED